MPDSHCKDCGADRAFDCLRADINYRRACLARAARKDGFGVAHCRQTASEIRGMVLALSIMGANCNRFVSLEAEYRATDESESRAIAACRGSRRKH